MHYKITRCNWLAVLIFITICNIQIAAAAAVKISGVIEAEIGTATDFAKAKSSDIVQATVEVGIDAEIAEWVSGHILGLYEEEDATGGPLIIDEATITFGNEYLSPFSLTIGQQYLPFGFFETNMVSDPLTLEIGETADSAVTFAYDGDFNFAAYLFNGDVNLNDADPLNDEKIEKFGVNLGYVFEGEDLVLDIGTGYINSIGDSNGLGDAINEATLGAGVTKFIPGIASHLLLEWGKFVFIADHVFATDEFPSPELLAAAAAKPSAMNIEFALSVSEDATLALGVQQTVDLAGYLPESRVLFALSYGVADDTGIAVEIVKDTDYSLLDGGSGEDATTFTVQVATEF